MVEQQGKFAMVTQIKFKDVGTLDALQSIRSIVPKLANINPDKLRDLGWVYAAIEDTEFIFDEDAINLAEAVKLADVQTLYAARVEDCVGSDDFTVYALEPTQKDIEKLQQHELDFIANFDGLIFTLPIVQFMVYRPRWDPRKFTIGNETVVLGVVVMGEPSFVQEATKEQGWTRFE
jgi:hypothetical protein